MRQMPSSELSRAGIRALVATHIAGTSVVVRPPHDIVGLALGIFPVKAI